MGWDTISSLPTWLGVALLIYWAAIVVVMLNDGRDPTKTLAWMLFLGAIPIVGLVFYFFFGRNWKKKTAKGRWIRQYTALSTPILSSVRERYTQIANDARALTKSWGQDDIVDLIARTDGAVPLPAHDVEILLNGQSKFAALKKDLAQATETINIQYFIWERDELTATLIDILIERLKAGVEVRMLNDFVGSIWYKKDQIKTLRRAGAKVAYDVRGLGKANYRNHRKIVVIDGALGYTGGINVGQEYIDGKPRYDSWRDTHVRFRGAAVADLQRLFAARWNEVTGENLFSPRFFCDRYPETGPTTLAQTVATGVEDPWDSARRAHVVAMADAKTRIWIQSPYFVPTADVYEGMINAALGGIDVRLMMTGVPDKRIAWYAAETYFRPLIEAGAKVYLYEAGFFHAKTLSIDSRLLSIGTMNMDVRSLALHKELMVWFYDEALAAWHDEVFESDMELCRVVTIEELDTRSRLELLRNNAARLASSLL
ncbi:MAG: cardiolipin synthase [Coriobacteriia bacterium]|nr:cardiolipin synthase [Coriobacteriia bacterium]